MPSMLVTEAMAQSTAIYIPLRFDFLDVSPVLALLPTSIQTLMISLNQSTSLTSTQIQAFARCIVGHLQLDRTVFILSSNDYFEYMIEAFQTAMSADGCVKPHFVAFTKDIGASCSHVRCPIIS